MTTQESGGGLLPPGWGGGGAGGPLPPGVGGAWRPSAPQRFPSEGQLSHRPRGTGWMPSFLPCSTRISSLCLYGAYA